MDRRPGASIAAKTLRLQYLLSFAVHVLAAVSGMRVAEAGTLPAVLRPVLLVYVKSYQATFAKLPLALQVEPLRSIL